MRRFLKNYLIFPQHVSYKVWLKLAKWFLRRRHLQENVEAGWTTDAAPWQKLLWPSARQAKNQKWKYTISYRNKDPCSTCIHRYKTFSFKQKCCSFFKILISLKQKQTKTVDEYRKQLYI